MEDSFCDPKMYLYFLIILGDLYSEEDKKKYWDEVYNNDQTDKKRDYERRLKAYNAQSGTLREELLNRFLSTDGVSLTFGECTSYGEELNSIFIDKEIRRQHYDRFFEVFIKISEKRGEEISKYTFENFCPKIDEDLPVVIERVEKLSKALENNTPKISAVITSCIAMHLEK